MGLRPLGAFFESEAVGLPIEVWNPLSKVLLVYTRLVNRPTQDSKKQSLHHPAKMFARSHQRNGLHISQRFTMGTLVPDVDQ